ncbi:hypothetical protein [Flavobacterium sp. H4147]|uniref:hypothetical protein n=1 Tax=Flavobacterium sp. H4147 TaxID=3034149 RepID=UPI0023EC5C57|nr:hypothetical protein [Flavobacterium sp. H4147]
MAIQTLNTIKNWFKTSLKPTQQQFWDTWDSFRHKYEKIPVNDIEGIQELLDSKTEESDFKTINGESIIGSGNIIIKEGELQNLDQVLTEGNASPQSVQFYAGGENIESASVIHTVNPYFNIIENKTVKVKNTLYANAMKIENTSGGIGNKTMVTYQDDAIGFSTDNGGVRINFPRLGRSLPTYLPLSVNGQFADLAGNIEVSGGSVSGTPNFVPVFNDSGDNVEISIMSRVDGILNIDTGLADTSGLRLQQLRNESVEYITTEYSIGSQYLQGMVYFPLTKSMYTGQQYDNGNVIEINQYGKVTLLNIEGNLVFINPMIPDKLISAKTYYTDNVRETRIYKWSPESGQEQIASYDGQLYKDITVDTQGNMYFITGELGAKVVKVTIDGLVTIISDTVNYPDKGVYRGVCDSEDNLILATSDLNSSLLKITAGTEEITRTDGNVGLGVAKMILRSDGKIAIIGGTDRQNAIITTAIYEFDGVYVYSVNEYEMGIITDVKDIDGHLEYLFQDWTDEKHYLVKETYSGDFIDNRIFIGEGFEKTPYNFDINQTNGSYYFAMPFGTKAGSLTLKSQPVLTVDELGNIIKDTSHPSVQEVLQIIKDSQKSNLQEVLEAGSIGFVNKPISLGNQSDVTININNGLYINANPSGTFDVGAGGSGGFRISQNGHYWNNYSNSPLQISSYSKGITLRGGNGSSIDITDSQFRLNGGSSEIVLAGGGSTGKTVIQNGGLNVVNGYSDFYNDVYVDIIKNRRTGEINNPMNIFSDNIMEIRSSLETYITACENGVQIIMDKPENTEKPEGYDFNMKLNAKSEIYAITEKLKVGGYGTSNITIHNDKIERVEANNTRIYPISINGQFADPNGNITISSTGDTQNLQSVIDNGNEVRDKGISFRNSEASYNVNLLQDTDDYLLVKGNLKAYGTLKATELIATSQINTPSINIGNFSGGQGLNFGINYISNASGNFDLFVAEEFHVNANVIFFRTSVGSFNFPSDKPNGNYTLATLDDLLEVFDNPTTTDLSAADLNTNYTQAKKGDSVHCLNIASGGKIYTKTTSGWVSQSVTAVI